MATELQVALEVAARETVGCLERHGYGAQSSIELVGIPDAEPMYDRPTCSSTGTVH